jgi:hypothetical protein
MRIFVSAVIAILVPGWAAAGTFDLSLDDLNGERILVVARSGGGSAAVAAGGEDLKVLRGEEAELAIARLARVDPAGDGGRATKKQKKIVIHKLDIDEGDSGDGREVRIVRKTDGGRREEELLRGEEDFLLEGAPVAERVERRIIRLKGFDAARAIKFIDETSGLDAGERLEMKTAAGL